jgi:Rrf2 family protein
MRITAKVDYAVRAAIELGHAGPRTPVKGDAIATAQGIPMKFLENILAELKHSGIVGSQRGAEGGYWLARPADEVSIADIIRAVEGPLAAVRGIQPQDLDYTGHAAPLQRVWVSVRASLRRVLEHITIADLVSGELDPDLEQLVDDPDSWVRR